MICTVLVRALNREPRQLLARAALAMSGLRAAPSAGGVFKRERAAQPCDTSIGAKHCEVLLGTGIPD
jgi:hypothetical protein